jgi:hypothetical protein
VKHSATNDQEQGETELSLLLSDGYTEPSSVRERVDVERGKRSRGEVRPSTAQEASARLPYGVSTTRHGGGGLRSNAAD